MLLVLFEHGAAGSNHRQAVDSCPKLGAGKERPKETLLDLHELRLRELETPTASESKTTGTPASPLTRPHPPHGAAPAPPPPEDDTAEGNRPEEPLEPEPRTPEPPPARGHVRAR